MQTFLPYEDFYLSASVLDNKRLFKQSIECKQILSAILGLSTGWKNHCITRLWQKHPDYLLDYWESINNELIIRKRPYVAIPIEIAEKVTMKSQYPSFLGDQKFHSAYRSHLLAKNEKHYRKFFKTEPAISGYFALDKNGNWKKYSEMVA
jgi:hypothetical protein